MPELKETIARLRPLIAAARYWREKCEMPDDDSPVPDIDSLVNAFVDDAPAIFDAAEECEKLRVELERVRIAINAAMPDFGTPRDASVIATWAIALIEQAAALRADKERLLKSLRDMVRAIHRPDTMSGVLLSQAESAIAQALQTNGRVPESTPEAKE